MLGEVGHLLAADYGWATDHKLSEETETAFIESHILSTILHGESLFASDLANGKKQAIKGFDAEFQLQLKLAGLLAPGFTRIMNGLCRTVAGAVRSGSLPPAQE